MMARANLGQLLGNVDESTTQVVPQAEPRQAARATEPAMPASTVTAPRLPSQVTPPTDVETIGPSAVDSTAPAYLHYVRKETRLREDQQNQLTVQARRLNRAKKTQGARITENSLIRVAVDLLLARIERASGDDEDAIRKSLGK